MLPNFLMALGVILLLAGAYLKIKATADPTEEPEAPAAEAPTPPTDEGKGLAFEQWVAERFPRDLFQLIHWHSDKRADNGRYAEGDRDPDMEVDLTIAKRTFAFAVE